MLLSDFRKYLLYFKFPAGTSRGTLTMKETWFVKIWDAADPTIFGIGECALFKGLSVDDRPDYQKKMAYFCDNINNFPWIEAELTAWPSIKFGLETALCDLKQGGTRILYPSLFTCGDAGIPINGLIWMGSSDFIRQQIREKLDAGFRCLKLKVGAIQLQEEIDLLASIRHEFHSHDLEIRLDANGAFPDAKAVEILEKFADYTIHSMEQPIKAGNPDLMSEICKLSPIPIALDEELIGINSLEAKRELLNLIAPSYIIIKPALTGGFSGAREWIEEAVSRHIGWWITSALESNIGLNAISQWTYKMNVNVIQGLGTGGMFTNNVASPLFVKNQEICFSKENAWDLTGIGFDEQ